MDITFCFANFVQNKGSLSMFCIALGAFIRRNTECKPVWLTLINNICRYVYIKRHFNKAWPIHKNQKTPLTQHTNRRLTDFKD